VATLEADTDAVHFLNEAFTHCKAIGFDADALQVIKATTSQENYLKIIMMQLF